MITKHLTRNLIIAAGGAFALWIIYLIIAFRECGGTSGNIEHLGLIGDFFGSLNALFSLLAFGGAICAIILQIHHHKEQKSHEIEMIVRSKLELLLSRLAMLRLAYMDESGNVDVRGGAQWDMQKGTSNIGVPLQECRVLVLLYFPSLNHWFSNFSLDGNLVKRFLNNPQVAQAEMSTALSDKGNLCSDIESQIVDTRNKLIREGSALSAVE